MRIFLMYKILRLATSLFIQAFVCVPEVSANIQIICADLDILNSVKCCEVSVQARTVMAQEWQLCWECPTEASYLRAAFMLQHTFVNRFPGAAIGHFQYPFLLSPPLKTPQFRRCVFQTCMLAVQFACIGRFALQLLLALLYFIACFPRVHTSSVSIGILRSIYLAILGSLHVPSIPFLPT